MSCYVHHRQHCCKPLCCSNGCGFNHCEKSNIAIANQISYINFVVSSLQLIMKHLKGVVLDIKKTVSSFSPSASSLLTDIALVHLAYHQTERKIHCFLQLLEIFPELSTILLLKNGEVEVSETINTL